MLHRGSSSHLAQRADKAEFVQGRYVHQAADVGDGGLGPLGEVSLQGIHVRIPAQPVARRFQLEPKRGQCGPEPIMQVAAALQVGGQTHRVNGRSRLPRQIVQQPRGAIIKRRDDPSVSRSSSASGCA